VTSPGNDSGDQQEQEVVVEQRDAVLVLRINRPDARNALNSAVMSGLGLGLEQAEADPAIRAVVITGTGDRAFCAGMDLRSFAAGSGTPSEDEQRGAALFGRFLREGFAMPVIGAANASAVAGGFEVLLACDLVVASEDAKFGLPEVKRALFAAGGGVLIGRRIPQAIALELTLTGDLIDAARAADLGLVNRVVAAADVVDEAVALGARIAANGPLAVQVTKRLVTQANVLPPDELYALQAELLPSVFESDDAKEGATAFIEKRDPVWTGH